MLSRGAIRDVLPGIPVVPLLVWPQMYAVCICSCCDVELSGMPLHGCMLWETPSMFPSSKHPKSCYNHPLSLFFLPNCRKLRASMYNPFKTPHKLHIFNLSLSSILFFLFKIQKHTVRASASCSSSLQPLPHCWKPIDPTVWETRV